MRHSYPRAKATGQLKLISMISLITSKLAKANPLIENPNFDRLKKKEAVNQEIGFSPSGNNKF